MIDPDAVHLPGVYVHRVVEVGANTEKRIERRTVRASLHQAPDAARSGQSKEN